MSLEDVKKQLKAISKSAATGHPKIAIAELCGVIQALVVVIEGLQWPKMTVLRADVVKPAGSGDHAPQVPDVTPTKSPQEKTRPTKNPGSPYEPSRVPRKRFNAGDAE